MRMSGFGNNPGKPGLSEAETVNSDTPSSGKPTQTANSFSENPAGAQLSKLSSVLNGLESGATIMRRHVQQAMNAVRGGTYRVDPVQLSKRIVGEALGSA